MRKILEMLDLSDPEGWLRLHRRLGLATLVLPLVLVVLVIVQVLSASRPHPVPPDRPGERFGLDDRARREIFSSFAEHEDTWRTQARIQFPDHEWSQSDSYFCHVKDHAVHYSFVHDLHYSQVFLIYDEGIHEHWPGKDGEPLPASTKPLEPRTK